MHRLFILFIFLFFISKSSGQSLIKLSELQKIIHEAGSIKVINFWATWCPPCVKELPIFEKINRENKNVRVLLVSMDYDLNPNPEKVKRFIDKKKLQAPVALLTEKNPIAWIDQIDPSWNGSLPFTLIVNPKNGKRKTVEGELKEGQLEKLIAEISK